MQRSADNQYGDSSKCPRHQKLQEESTLCSQLRRQLRRHLWLRMYASVTMAALAVVVVLSNLFIWIGKPPGKELVKEYAFIFVPVLLLYVPVVTVLNFCSYNLAKKINAQTDLSCLGVMLEFVDRVQLPRFLAPLERLLWQVGEDAAVSLSAKQRRSLYEIIHPSRYRWTKCDWDPLLEHRAALLPAALHAVAWLGEGDAIMSLHSFAARVSDSALRQQAISAIDRIQSRLNQQGNILVRAAQAPEATLLHPVESAPDTAQAQHLLHSVPAEIAAEAQTLSNATGDDDAGGS